MKKRLNALCCGLTISRRPRQQPTSGAPGVIGGAGQAQGQRHDTAALPGFVSSLTAAAENRVAEVRASPAGQLATQTDIQIAAPITNEPAVSNADTGGHETAVIAGGGDGNAPSTGESFVSDAGENLILSRYSFSNKDGFKQQTLQEYQDARRNKGGEIKDRSDMDMFDLEATAGEMYSTEDDPRSLVLSPHIAIKAVGYSSTDKPVMSTGTSQLNTLCFTDGMGPCIAAVVGGEKRQNDVRLQGAKVRVFHFFPNNTEICEVLSNCIKDFQADGLSVRMALHGGDEHPQSVELAQNLLATAEKFGITPEFDETCEDRITATMLGGIIENDNKVRFITKLLEPDDEIEKSSAENSPSPR